MYIVGCIVIKSMLSYWKVKILGNKILLRADCHIYPHGSSRDRAIECLNAFEWTYKVAVENDIKVVVDLGDVFHERAHVDSYTHSAAYKIAK